MKDIKTYYYTDELNDDFFKPDFKIKEINESWNYGDNSFSWKIRSFFWYKMIFRPFGHLIFKIVYHHKIENLKVLKPYKKNAYFLYGNHTNQMADPFIPAFICNPSYMYVIVHPGNVSQPGLGKIMPYLGALPLPSNLGATKNFMEIIKKRSSENKPIVIYPEAHIWPFYTKIRPFTDVSFRYPVQQNAPTFCFTNTYQKRKFTKRPKVITYIDGPFFINNDLSAKEQRKDLRDRVYAAMCERAKNNNLELAHYIKKTED